MFKMRSRPSLTVGVTHNQSERLGKNKEDYGMVWIESNNPAVPKMRIGVKFAIPRKSAL